MKTLPFITLTLIAFSTLGCNQAELTRLTKLSRQQKIELASAKAEAREAQQMASKALAQSERELSEASAMREASATLHQQATDAQADASQKLAAAEKLFQEAA